MKLTEVTTFAPKSRKILTEGWQDLTESQQLHINRWEKELWPLLEEYTKLAEATLTTDQIQQIFKGAEDTANASGSNTSMLGKIGNVAKLPVDVAKKVDQKINQLGSIAQKAGPVQNADAKFEKLKADILKNKPDSKIVQGVQKISDWAKANPGKATLGVAILTTIAAFMGGPAGGAAAGLVLRGTKDLLQGEKLSTAVGKSVKVAAYGALAGATFRYIQDAVWENIATAGDNDLAAISDSFDKANMEAAQEAVFADKGFEPGVLDGASKVSMQGNINNFYYNYDTVLNADQLDQYEAFKQALAGTETFSPEYYQEATKFHDFMMATQQQNKELTGLWKALSDIPDQEWTTDQVRQWTAASDNLDNLLNSIESSGDAAAAAVTGAMAAVDDTAKDAQKAKPIPPREKEQLELALKGGSMAQPVDKNFDKSQKLSDFGPVGDKAESIDMQARFEAYLAEADPVQGELPLNNPNTMGAKLKRGIGKAASAAGSAVSKGAAKVKAGAKELGSKVTVNKLMKAWKAKGSPTDTGSIMNILADAGMTNDQIAKIGQSVNVELKPTTASQSKPAASAKPMGVDIKSLAGQIKKAGVADQVKQMLLKNTPA